MKISFFIPNLLPGGAESVLITIINELVQRYPQYKVHLCISKTHKNQIKDIDSSIKVINFSKSKVRYCIKDLINYFKKEKPDYFISSLDYANIVSSFAHKYSFVNTKLILWEHSITSFHSKSTISRFKVIRKFLITYFYNRAYKIISVSNGVAKDLYESFNIPKEKLIVIYNPINYEKVIKLSELNSFEIDPIIQNGEYILSMGRLAKPKNIELLVRSFKDVEYKNKLKLLIMGDGPDKENIKKLIHKLKVENSVFLIGFHENPYTILKKAKALISSSNWEGFPLVLLEALALGKQIISTDCPSGPREILSDGEYGILVPVNSSEHLSLAITNLVNKKYVFDSRKLKNRAKHYSLDRAMEIFVKILN